LLLGVVALFFVAIVATVITAIVRPESLTVVATIAGSTVTSAGVLVAALQSVLNGTALRAVHGDMNHRLDELFQKSDQTGLIAAYNVGVETDPSDARSRADGLQKLKALGVERAREQAIASAKISSPPTSEPEPAPVPPKAAPT
jgi:hypothetical protein